MKKSITIIILSVIIIISAVPLGFGFWAESRMNGIMEKMSSSDVLDFTVIQQDRGWLSSTYDIAIELTGEASEAYREYLMGVDQQNAQQNIYQGYLGDDVQPLTVVIRNVIKHGPFPSDGFPAGKFSLIPVIATIDTKFISISGADNVRSANEFLVPYTIRSLISLTGNIISAVTIEPWSGVPEDGKVHIDWKGLNAELRYNVVDGEMKGKISMPSFSTRTDNKNILLSDVNIDIDARESNQPVSLGEMSIHIGGLKFNNQLDAVRNFVIEDCNIKVNSDLVEGSINSTVGMTVERLQSGKRSFGPGKYELKLSNLDADSFITINQQVKELQSQGVPGEQMGMMMSADMFSVWPDFLAKGPRLEISSLSLESDYGIFRGSGQISIDTSNEVALKNPMLLKEAIIAELEFTIPEELLVLFKTLEVKNDMSILGVEAGAVKNDSEIESIARVMVKNEMDILVNQNIFIRENSNQYRVRASFIEGKLSINGAEFNLPVMEQQMGGQSRLPAQ